MNKKAKTILSLALLVAVISILVVGIVIAVPNPRAAKACSDGLDNDGDGLTDWPEDPGCANKNDKTETNPDVECDDGLDNDGDSAVDYDDNGCSSPTDTDETDCGDGVCEGGEDCDNCAADCLGGGQVCCSGVAYTGDCCDNNDCTEPATCVSHVCQIADSCSDTDGGYVPEVKGTISGYDDEIYYSNEDYCTGDTLTEYYCGGVNPYSWDVDCAVNGTAICSNGACVDI